MYESSSLEGETQATRRHPHTDAQICLADNVLMVVLIFCFSELPIPIKPRFLMQLEEKIRSDKAKYKIPDDICSPVRLQVIIYH